MDDGHWLAERLGAHLAGALMSHLDVAERDRLIRTYGYAKDNAWPPALAERLADPAFVRCLLESIEADDEPARGDLRGAILRLRRDDAVT